MTSAKPSGDILGYKPAHVRPTHVRYVVLTFLCALSFLTYFDRVCIMRAQPEIQRDLFVSDAQMGWIFSAFWLAYALFEIPGGWMAERFGARRTLTRIVLAWSLFTALSGSAGGFLSLLTFRFLFGVGEAGAYPGIARVQSRWLPASVQGRASGFLWLIARWGGALSPKLFGMALRAVDNSSFRSTMSHIPGLHALATLPAWRMGFWLCGLVGLVWVVLFYPWFRDDPAENPSVNQAELDLIRGDAPAAKEELKNHHGAIPGLWAAMLTSRSLWAMSLGYIFGNFGWSFFVSWLPKFLLQVHKINYAGSEWIAAAPLLCGGLACLGGGYISDAIIRATGRRTFGRALLPMLGRTIAAVSIIGVVLVHSPWQVVVLLCITMAAYDLGQSSNWAAIIEIGGAHAGVAAGFVNTLGNLGNFIQPVVGQFIFNRFGWPTLFAVYATMFLLSAAVWFFIDPTEQFYRPEEFTA